MSHVVRGAPLGVMESACSLCPGAEWPTACPAPPSPVAAPGVGTSPRAKQTVLAQGLGCRCFQVTWGQRECLWWEVRGQEGGPAPPRRAGFGGGAREAQTPGLWPEGDGPGRQSSKSLRSAFPASLGPDAGVASLRASLQGSLLLANK